MFSLIHFHGNETSIDALDRLDDIKWNTDNRGAHLRDINALESTARVAESTLGTTRRQERARWKAAIGGRGVCWRSKSRHVLITVRSSRRNRVPVFARLLHHRVVALLCHVALLFVLVHRSSRLDRLERLLSVINIRIDLYWIVTIS